MKFKVILLIHIVAILLILSYNPTQQASAQTANCPPITTPRVERGLVSAPTIAAKFTNQEGTCVTELPAALPAHDIPTYDKLKLKFYDRAASGMPKAEVTVFPPNDVSCANNFCGNKLYYAAGNIDIGTRSAPATTLTPTGTGAQVFFIGGNLDINQNLIYADNDQNSGLVFIVKGNIYIDHAVTRVNAVLISSGTLCTDSDSGTCPAGSASASRNQLTVNGSLISLGADDAGGTTKLRLRRLLFDNSQPGEIINAQPKYLVILKDLLAEDLQIWAEAQ